MRIANSHFLFILFVLFCVSMLFLFNHVPTLLGGNVRPMHSRAEAWKRGKMFNNRMGRMSRIENGHQPLPVYPVYLVNPVNPFQCFHADLVCMRRSGLCVVLQVDVMALC